LDWPYRIAVGVLFGSNSLIRFLAAKAPASPVSKRDARTRRDGLLRFLVRSTAIPALLYVFTPLLQPLAFGAPAVLRWLGGALAAVGTVLFARTHRALGKEWSTTLEIREGHRLVSDGPYGVVRHPMYSALFLVAIGLGLLSANWLVLIARPLALVALAAVRVPSEERMLREHFGGVWDRYRERTGAWIPRFREKK
jgi:protein-S-isoprenylcysteine O-methyltransferase Ste14